MNMPGKRYREFEKSVVSMHTSIFSIHKLHTINSDYIINANNRLALLYLTVSFASHQRFLDCCTLKMDIYQSTSRKTPEDLNFWVGTEFWKVIQFKFNIWKVKDVSCLLIVLEFGSFFKSSAI